MKRKTIVGLITIAAIVTVAIFAGCVEPTITPTPTSKTELLLGESAVVNDILFTLLEYEFEDSCRCEYIYDNRSETSYPAEGAKFLWVRVKAENVGEIAREAPPKAYINLLYKSTKSGYGSACGMYRKPERIVYNGGEIYPTVNKEGWIIYEVPKNIDMSQAKICVEFPKKRYAPYGQGETVTWSF
jgi:hypothetical protein